MSQASGSDSLDTEGTLTIVCERVTYVEHQLCDLQIQLRKARVSFSSLPAAGRARRALIIIMSDSHAFTSPVPLPTFSLSGAGEVSSEGGAVPEGCAVQSESTSFPFPPEPPGLNSLQVPESPVPSVAVQPEEVEQESPGPWDLLREISEVDVDSLKGYDFEPPSPSYVQSYDMEIWEGAGGERAWYSPVEEDLPGVSVPEPDSTSPGEAGWDPEASGLTAEGLEVQLQQQAALALVKRRRTSLMFPWERPLSAVHGACNLRTQIIPQVGLRETLQVPRDVPPLPSDASGVSWSVASRLRRIRIPISDDELRAGALKRLKVLVLLDPEGTQLGMSLLQKTLTLKDDDEIRQSLSDAFKGKAATTLQKRGLSLQAFVAKHFEVHEGSPWRVSEDQLYATLCALRAGGAKASTANHMLEALRLMECVSSFLSALT